MALATRPRPKAHQKKRQAKHHRQSKHYIKAYWPYLPMVGILALGVAANNWLAEGDIINARLNQVQLTEASASLTRLDVLTGNHAAWSLAVLAITFAAFSYFVITHWYRLHRLLNRGERFIIRHPAFDIITVFIFTAGAVLTRSLSLA